MYVYGIMDIESQVNKLCEAMQVLAFFKFRFLFSQTLVGVCQTRKANQICRPTSKILKCVICYKATMDERRGELQKASSDAISEEISGAAETATEPLTESNRENSSSQSQHNYSQ